MTSTLRFSSLILASLLLAACGGGGGSSGSETTPPAGGTPPPPPPPPAPVNEASVYKATLQTVVGSLLFVEDIGKSPLKNVPTLIASQVTAHGVLPACGGPCDLLDSNRRFDVSFPAGGVVTVADWVDLDSNSAFDPQSEQLTFDLANVGGITGSSMVQRSSPEVYLLTLGARFDTPASVGAQVGSTQTLRYAGALMIRELPNARLRIGDFDGGPPSTTRNIVLQQTTVAGVQVTGLETRFTMDTNGGDRDAITASFDWIRFSDGLKQSFASTSVLNFGEVNGVLQLEAGSFVYEQDSGSAKLQLRVSVDADPAFLLVEIDEGADGTFDKSGRLAQADLNYILP